MVGSFARIDALEVFFVTFFLLGSLDCLFVVRVALGFFGTTDMLLHFCFRRLVTRCNGFGEKNVFADEIERPLFEFLQLDICTRDQLFTECGSNMQIGPSIMPRLCSSHLLYQAFDLVTNSLLFPTAPLRLRDNSCRSGGHVSPHA